MQDLVFLSISLHLDWYEAMNSPSVHHINPTQCSYKFVHENIPCSQAQRHLLPNPYQTIQTLLTLSILYIPINKYPFTLLLFFRCPDVHVHAQNIHATHMLRWMDLIEDTTSVLGCRWFHAVERAWHLYQRLPWLSGRTQVLEYSVEVNIRLKRKNFIVVQWDDEQSVQKNFTTKTVLFAKGCTKPVHDINTNHRLYKTNVL